MVCHDDISGIGHAFGSATIVSWRSLLVLLMLRGVPACAAGAGAADLEFPNETLTRIAFGSCHKTKFARSDLWPRILNVDNNDNQNQNKTPLTPQVWIWMGDSIYPPNSKGIASVSSLQAEYGRMKSPENTTIGYGPQLQKHPYLHVFGSWDDHDYGANDYGKDMPDKHARKRAFWDFLGLPDADNNWLASDRNGTYMSVVFGNQEEEEKRVVKIILLDTRWHRDSHCIPSVAAIRWLPLAAGWACATRWFAAGCLPQWCTRTCQSKTILGHQQWTWLEEQLLESTAAVHLVVSSIQLLSTNPAMEGWGHFPRERRRLIQLLTKVKNAYVLSGDVHHAEILDPAAQIASHRADDSSSFLEITSSGLTHTCTKGLFGLLCRPLLTIFHRHRSDPSAYFVGRNFGRIFLDWDMRQITISIFNAATGEQVLTTGPRTIRKHAAVEWTQEELDTVTDCLNGHLVGIVVALLILLLSTILYVRRY